jgi:hypothetical protein
VILASWTALDATERVARCRALAALVRVFAGPAAAELAALLRKAEADPEFLATADAALAALPTRAMRNALSTLAETLP